MAIEKSLAQSVKIKVGQTLVTNRRVGLPWGYDQHGFTELGLRPCLFIVIMNAGKNTVDNTIPDTDS